MITAATGFRNGPATGFRPSLRNRANATFKGNPTVTRKKTNIAPIQAAAHGNQAALPASARPKSSTKSADTSSY